MELISTVIGIKDNITRLEDYLSSSKTKEQDYAIARIKYGTCFVAYKSKGMTKFAPSRFIGYKNNTITKHESNITKDGRETNPAISDALGVKQPIINEELEELYKKYCIYLGFSPPPKGAFGVTRKYWILP